MITIGKVSDCKPTRAEIDSKWHSLPDEERLKISKDIGDNIKKHLQGFYMGELAYQASRLGQSKWRGAELDYELYAYRILECAYKEAKIRLGEKDKQKSDKDERMVAQIHFFNIIYEIASGKNADDYNLKERGIPLGTELPIDSSEETIKAVSDTDVEYKGQTMCLADVTKMLIADLGEDLYWSWTGKGER